MGVGFTENPPPRLAHGRMRAPSTRLALATLLAGLTLLALDGAALAQFAHHPFAVGANEGAVGHQNAFGAWLLGQESRFYLSLTHAVRATKESAYGALGLVGLSFAYGVLHAAGPGHGKAVITSYMVSNEVALRRGLLIALLAAVLQGLVAAALVGIAAVMFHATAPRMTAAAETIEFVSYLGIVTLGLFLCWRKGWRLIAAVWPEPLTSSFAFAAASPPVARFSLESPRRGSGRFQADDGYHLHDDDCACGHAHMPDPRRFGAERFDVKAAALAVLTAGARPCSGAILVLVFALAQGIFVAGIAATFAMSIGTAITTGALAIAAVYAKDLAVRLSGRASKRGVVIGRLVELLAAACVLVFGVALLAASLAGLHTSG